MAGLVIALALPAGASGASIGTIYRDYSADGAIDPCKYSAADLQAALGAVPTDVQQYDPRFVSALNRALEARSAGACSKGGAKGSTSSGGGGAATGTGVPPSTGGSGSAVGPSSAPDGSPTPSGAPSSTAAVPVSETGGDLDDEGGFPLWLGILGGMLALALIGGGGLVLGRRQGWGTDPGTGTQAWGDRLSR